MRFPVPLSTLALLAASTCALADPVLSPTLVNIQLIDGSSRTQYVNNTAPPQTKTLSIAPTNATLTASYVLNHDPSLSASLTYSGAPDNTSFDAISQINYEFLVAGPADTRVSLTFTGAEAASVSTYVTGGFNASAIANISLLGSQSYLVHETASSSGVGYVTSGSNTFNDTFSVLTNTVYDVDLETSAGFYAVRPTGDYNATATLDPTLTLDTTDPAYTLQFSPGLLDTTSAATPEPSSLLLAATGLLTSAARLRRRRTPSAT